MTYITPDEATHAHKLVKILRETNQEVTEDLLNLVKVSHCAIIFPVKSCYAKYFL